MSKKKKKHLSVLPDQIPKNIPSLKPFYANLPPLPQVYLPLSPLFIALDSQLVYQGLPRGYELFVADLVKLLDKQFGVRKLIEAGSSRTGTGIRERCDIDCLVCLRYSIVPEDSSEMLDQVYGCLQPKFGAAAKLDSPAVVIRFGESFGEQVDLVPIFNMHDPDHLAELGYPDYVPSAPIEEFYLPGFSGDWLPTNPVHHIDLIEKVDCRQRGRVRRLIRLLKLWKYGHNIPIVSYYLESFVLQLAYEEKFSDSPQLDMFKILCCIKYIFQQPNVSIVDPNIYSDWGRIVPCTKENFPRVKEAVHHTAYLATLAMDNEWHGNFDAAKEIWSNIFNRQIA